MFKYNKLSEFLKVGFCFKMQFYLGNENFHWIYD